MSPHRPRHPRRRRWPGVRIRHLRRRHDGPIAGADRPEAMHVLRGMR